MNDAANSHDIVHTLPSGSIIQSGPYNNRVYLMNLAPTAPETEAVDLITRAQKKGYSKIFAKVPELQAGPFVQAGYVEEARIPAFYRGKETAIFFAFYVDPAREHETNSMALNAILEFAQTKGGNPVSPPLASRFNLRPCTPGDAQEMAKIYRRIFQSYPFPIHDPDYIVSTMKSHIDCFGIEADGKLIALASAETDRSAGNVEMTDFATLPDWLGNRFARHLLARMEQEMKAKDIKTAYTIARAASHGANITFGRAGYTFGGRLKNNTHISGQIESMNVWYKSLQKLS